MKTRHCTSLPAIKYITFLFLFLFRIGHRAKLYEKRKEKQKCFSEFEARMSKLM